MSTPEQKSQPLPEARRISSVTFVAPTLHDARSAVSVDNKTCLSITPALLMPDGDCAPIKEGQRADGLMIRRRITQPKEHVIRDFIPWANVANVRYAE